MLREICIIDSLSLLGNYALASGKWLLRFQRKVLFLPLESSSQKSMLGSACDTMILPNVSNC